MSTNAKKLSQLRPSDVVMVELSEVSEFNRETGKKQTLKHEVIQDVPYSKWMNDTDKKLEDFTPDENDPLSGYSKVLGRTIKLLGTAGYKEEIVGDVKVNQPYVIPFKDESEPDASLVPQADKASELNEIEIQKAELEELKRQLEEERKKLDKEREKLAKDKKKSEPKNPADTNEEGGEA